MPDSSVVELARKQLKCQRSPVDFAEVISGGKYRRAWHIEKINDVLMKLYRGEIKRLIVTMPPRHSKSETCSRYFSSWWLGMRPDDRVMLASYESDFATTWGRKARDILEEVGDEIFGIHVSEKSSAANRWDIDGHDGGMVTVGVGGALTGKGANLLILDDYIKNSEEARSDTVRNKVWDWWQGTARTRLEPDARVVIIATRWNSDDLIGRILDNDADDEWTVLALPAIAMEDEEFRKEGEALWPSQFPLSELLSIRKDIGAYWFNAEYQCSPTSEEGNMFKRADTRYWSAGKGIDMNGKSFDGYLLHQVVGEAVPVKASQCWKFITMDLAASQSERADYTVVAVWAVTPSADMLLLDVARKRMIASEKIPTLRAMAELHKVDYIGIEKGSFQLDFIQRARDDGLNVLKLEPKGDKTERAHEASIKWKGGGIYVPKTNQTWLSDFLEELYAFDNGVHDDCVDVTSYAAIEVNKRGFSVASAYGLVECFKCGKLYACNEKTGWDRPCTACGTRQPHDAEDTSGIPLLTPVEPPEEPEVELPHANRMNRAGHHG